MDRENLMKEYEQEMLDEMEMRALDEMRFIAEHVVGRESSAWDKWWAYASTNPLKLQSVLLGTLLSLGAPPHPAFLTGDLKAIVLRSAPNKYARGGRDYRRWLQVFERQQKTMQPYIMALNNACVQHGLVYTHRIHDPAQFRKLFAAMIGLHACKVEGRDAKDER